MTCEDAGCCGCCDPQNGYVSPELAEEMRQDEMDRDWEENDEMDGDHESALASVYGTDERFPDDMHCDGYDEH